MHPWPGAWCMLPDKTREKRLKVHKARALHLAECAQVGVTAKMDPGQILRLKNRMILRCGSTALELLKIQPEGKKPMEINSFLAGAHLPEQLVLF